MTHPYRTAAEMPQEPRQRWGVTWWRRLLYKARHGWKDPDVRRVERSLERIAAESERQIESLARMKAELEGYDAELARVTRLLDAGARPTNPEDK